MYIIKIINLYLYKCNTQNQTNVCFIASWQCNKDANAKAIMLLILNQLLSHHKENKNYSNLIVLYINV